MAYRDVRRDRGRRSELDTAIIVLTTFDAPVALGDHGSWRLRGVEPDTRAADHPTRTACAIVVGDGVNEVFQPAVAQENPVRTVQGR